MCDCIERTEKLLTEKMKEMYPGWNVVDEVKLQNKTFRSGKKANIILINPVSGRVQKGKQTRKFEASMVPDYCPFCGEKLEL